MILHPIEPVFNADSKILILGSFPSVKSRETAFFYGHPQNRFWKVVSAVVGEEEPKDIPERCAFLLRNGIALWDVIASCEIEGSADSTIKDVKANDLSRILGHADIKAIFVNGKTAKKYYDRYILPVIGCEAISLPSTSPANAAFGLSRLVDAWKVICSI